MKALDLFCGVGGLTHGLARAGWEVVAGIDIDGGLATTYERNNPSARFINADIKKINIEEVDSLLKGCSRKELLLAGCAPCQPFSKQRRGPRSRNGVEGTLMGEFGRLVRLLRPKVILMENVPGIARVPGFSAYRRFLQTLRVCGYSIDQCTLNARDFGVPQHRRRLVLLAVLEVE